MGFPVVSKWSSRALAVRKARSKHVSDRQLVLQAVSKLQGCIPVVTLTNWCAATARLQKALVTSTDLSCPDAS